MGAKMCSLLLGFTTTTTTTSTVVDCVDLKWKMPVVRGIEQRCVVACVVPMMMIVEMLKIFVIFVRTCGRLCRRLNAGEASELIRAADKHRIELEYVFDQQALVIRR